VALNRAVAIAMVFGPPAGLLEIDAVADHPALQDYYLLPATRGELKRRLGDHAEAAVDFRHALTLAEVTPVRRFLEKKLAALGAPV
ncbi:MAG: RNA polymerase subunit sigma, partial [Proteobacteria bacterium]|nr:RNA polymerase subunit sigma [Pseudomonadota bacterium]